MAKDLKLNISIAIAILSAIILIINAAPNHLGGRSREGFGFGNGRGFGGVNGFGNNGFGVNGFGNNGFGVNPFGLAAVGLLILPNGSVYNISAAALIPGITFPTFFNNFTTGAFNNNNNFPANQAGGFDLRTGQVFG